MSIALLHVVRYRGQYHLDLTLHRCVCKALGHISSVMDIAYFHYFIACELNERSYGPLC